MSATLYPPPSNSSNDDMGHYIHTAPTTPASSNPTILRTLVTPLASNISPIPRTNHKRILLLNASTTHSWQQPNHSGLDPTFWEDALRDVIFRYNISIHNKTGTSPYVLWHGEHPHMVKLFIFGQLGTIPVYHTKKKKLEPRADPARYMYPISPTQITVFNLRSQSYQKLRAIDFRPYDRMTDPVYIYHRALSTLISTPPYITEITPAPSSLKQGRKYPDAAQWATVHITELDSIDEQNIITWNQSPPLGKPCRPIRLTMTYKYKRDV